MTSPIGFVLGTGWGKIIEEIKSEKEVSFEKIFGQKTSVPGHTGRAIFARLFNKKVVFLSGRFHSYEGYSAYETTKTVRFLHQQGVKKLILTSACGALNPKYQVGDLVILLDMITLFSQSPLQGPQFQNLSSPFSKTMQKRAEKAAFETNLNYQKGIYAYVHGPHYETFTDKMALQFLGADVVGMSIVPEVIMANYLKMEVLGLPLVTNLAFVKHSHREVLATAKSQEKRLFQFIKKLMQKL